MPRARVVTRRAARDRDDGVSSSSARNVVISWKVLVPDPELTRLLELPAST